MTKENTKAMLRERKCFQCAHFLSNLSCIIDAGSCTKFDINVRAFEMRCNYEYFKELFVQ